MSFLNDQYYDGLLRGRISWEICRTISEAIKEGTPVKVYEASWVCRAHAVEHRFDFRRGGQDICDARINFTTDGKGNVTAATIG